jgi:hypothetical protein
LWNASDALGMEHIIVIAVMCATLSMFALMIWAGQHQS